VLFVFFVVKIRVFFVVKFPSKAGVRHEMCKFLFYYKAARAVL